MLTDRYDEALLYARTLHNTQLRKGTTIPYFAHLVAVSALVLEGGGDEDMAIAALLHDAAEDQGGQATLDEIERRFGARVAGIVRSCSDSLTTDPDAKAPWAERKQAYLKHLRAATDRGYLLVSCADKLHNARAILTDFRTHGGRFWERFKGKSPEQIVGYYAGLAEAFEDRLGRAHPLARELASVVTMIVDKVARDLPSLEQVLAVATDFRMDSAPGIVVLTEDGGGLGAFRCRAGERPIRIDVVDARLDGRPISEGAAMALLTDKRAD